jgi:hypothetical protein
MLTKANMKGRLKPAPSRDRLGRLIPTKTDRQAQLGVNRRIKLIHKKLLECQEIIDTYPECQLILKLFDNMPALEYYAKDNTWVEGNKRGKWNVKEL